MTKKLFIVLILMPILSSCIPDYGGEKTIRTTNCYERAGGYLASGRVWDEPGGRVKEVFYAYNKDNWELWITPVYDRQDVEEWLENGWRVVMQYENNIGGEHSEPVWNVDECERVKDRITWMYVTYPPDEEWTKENQDQ